MTPSESGEREAAGLARLEVRPQAQADIEGAYGWYERQRSDLGKKFVRAVDAALASVRNRPETYARVHGETRRATVPGYPYSVFYLAERDTVVVLAVTQHRRHPRHWRTRR